MPALVKAPVQLAVGWRPASAWASFRSWFATDQWDGSLGAEIRTVRTGGLIVSTVDAPAGRRERLQSADEAGCRGDRGAPPRGIGRDPPPADGDRSARAAQAPHPPGEDRFDEVARCVRAVAQSLAEFTNYRRRGLASPPPTGMTWLPSSSRRTPSPGRDPRAVARGRAAVGQPATRHTRGDPPVRGIRAHPGRVHGGIPRDVGGFGPGRGRERPPGTRPALTLRILFHTSTTCSWLQAERKRAERIRRTNSSMSQGAIRISEPPPRGALFGPGTTISDGSRTNRTARYCGLAGEEGFEPSIS